MPHNDLDRGRVINAATSRDGDAGQPSIELDGLRALRERNALAGIRSRRRPATATNRLNDAPGASGSSWRSGSRLSANRPRITALMLKKRDCRSDFQRIGAAPGATLTCRADEEASLHHYRRRAGRVRAAPWPASLSAGNAGLENPCFAGQEGGRGSGARAGGGGRPRAASACRGRPSG